jgi:hypothetical protein
VVVGLKVLVGGPLMCLPPRWVGFLTSRSPAGFFAEVWLERAESTFDPDQGCPPRFITERRASGKPMGSCRKPTTTFGTPPRRAMPEQVIARMGAELGGASAGSWP